MLGRCAALGVSALGDLLDDFRGEGFEVAGLKTMRCQGRRRIISPPRAFSAG
jgi:hypothetical protein